MNTYDSALSNRFVAKCLIKLKDLNDYIPDYVEKISLNKWDSEDIKTEIRLQTEDVSPSANFGLDSIAEESKQLFGKNFKKKGLRYSRTRDI